MRSAYSWAGLWLAACFSGVPAAAMSADQAAPAASASAAPVAEIPFVSAHQTMVTTQSDANAWGGERKGNEPTLSDRLVSYTIDAKLDAPKHQVAAQEHMTWRNRSNQPVGSVYFHLYLNAFSNEKTTLFSERKVLTAHSSGRGLATPGKGEWGWIQLNSVQQDGHALHWAFVHPDGGPAEDHTVVRIDLAEPVPAGGTLALDIGFLDQLPRVIERTGYFGNFNLVGQWFPKIGVLELAGERGATAPRWNVHEFHFSSEFYADFGYYDVHLTAPDDYTVGAVGELQGTPVKKDGNTTYHYTQGDVHDFAWVAAKDFKTLDGSWQGPGTPKVAVRVIYPADYAATAAPTLKSSIDSLAYFSRTLGPYPYHTLTAVVPAYNAAEAGGMEYPTFFTSDGYRDVSPDTYTQTMSDFVNIHEFGHGYFYGLLATNEFEEPTLDEGMNEFWDQRMLRERKQPLILANKLMAWLGVQPKVYGFTYERISATLLHPADPLDQNSWDRLSSESYLTVYTRTATAMHDLEERLGTPALEKAMKLYYQRWHFRHPSAADLRAALIDSSGDARDVDQIFNNYFYGTGSMDDRVVSIDTNEVLPEAGVFDHNGKAEELVATDLDKQVAQQRKDWDKAHPNAKPADGGPFPWHSIVTVQRDGVSAPELLRVTFADGSKQDLQWNDDRRWVRFEFTKPVKVVSAELDPEHHNYLDRNWINNSLTTEANGSASKRWSADVAAVLQSFYSLLGTL